MRRSHLRGLAVASSIIAVLAAAPTASAHKRYGTLLERSTEEDLNVGPFMLVSGFRFRPHRFYVRVRSSPRATVQLDWNLDCRRGRRSAHDKEGNVLRYGAFVQRIRPNLRRASICSLALTAEMYQPGKLSVRLYGKKRRRR